MASLNKVMLMGRLTRDPEIRYTPKGDPVSQFAIATNRYGSGADGERREYTDYHNIVAWNIGRRNLAQQVADYLRKGSLVYVEGRLQTRSWEGQDGQKRKTTEVVATDVQFLEPRGAGVAVGNGAASDDLPALAEDSARDVDPDEIPF
jgi:single-strand DNA-binding protein